MATPVSIVVVISGNGSNLQSITDGIASGQIHAKIRAVISNVPDAYGLTRAETARIPTETVDHTQFEDREDFDRELRATIDHYSPELVILAGFMRKLGSSFVEHYRGRLLNIHPSLLPAYPGLHTHQRALADEATEHGASIHFVTADLDAGPIIIQSAVPVKEDDDETSLARRVQKEEHIIYPMVVGWFIDKRLELVDDQVLLDGIPLSSPVIRRDGNTLLPASHHKVSETEDGTDDDNAATSQTGEPSSPSSDNDSAPISEQT